MKSKIVSISVVLMLSSAGMLWAQGDASVVPTASPSPAVSAGSNASPIAAEKALSMTLYLRGGYGYSDVSGMGGHHRHDDFFDGTDATVQRRAGFDAGVGVLLPMTSWLALRPELNYVQKGVLSYQRYDEFDIQSIQHSIQSQYIELPVMVSLSYPTSGALRASVSVGGYGAYMLKGLHQQTLIDPTTGAVSGTLPDQTAADMQRFDAGAVAALGLSYHLSGMSVFVEARVSHGVIEVVDGQHDLVNRRAELSLGLAFGD